jgi:hypothetical protein
MPSVPRSGYRLCMSYVPLGSFAALTLGDYGLWKWSLAGNHQVLAVVFGLTLPPLALAFAWMLVIRSIRLFGTLTRRPPEPAPPRLAQPGRPLGARLTGRAAALRPVVKPRVRVRPRVAKAPAKATGGGRSPERPPGKLAA